MAAFRTPPGRLSTPQQVASESDISKLDPETPVSFVGRRPKRARQEGDTQSDEPSLKDELMAMLCNWKKDQDVMMNKLCLEISELKQQNTNIKSNTDELEKSMKFISLQYEDMKTKLLDMERERKENLSYITSLENKIDELQKKAKFTVIEVRNLPQQNKPETQQELCELVQKACQSINTDVHLSEIRDIHRITTKNGATSVVVDLTSVLTKNKILNAVKDYNKDNFSNKLSTSTIGLQGPKMPIYIAESLTNKDRKLFAMTREASKTLQYKYCWTKWGKIFVKKVDGSTRIEIKNESDLTRLQNM